MISQLEAPSVQRNVKKGLENASFEKLIVLLSSGTTCLSSVVTNLYVGWGVELKSYMTLKFHNIQNVALKVHANPEKLHLNFPVEPCECQRSS